MKQNLENIFISGFDNEFIGDDGAVVGDYIYSNDAFFEDIHFKREWLSLEQIGFKAMIVNISDAIAMNATPKYALLTIAMPKTFTSGEARQLQKGIKKACRKYSIKIIGGDTISNIKLDLSITIISKSSNPLYRKGVKAGDLLAFTGRLGQSNKDLQTLLVKGKIPTSSKFIKPKLRVDFVYQSRAFLNAGMDISDGLFFELERLSKINKVGFEFLKKIDEKVGCSGEEYEMLISFDETNRQKVQDIAKQTKTKLTIFAKAVKGKFECVCKPWHF